MRIALFYHSLISDWNHGNAHFLRGIATELIERGHAVQIYEPHDAWSVQNVLREHGEAAIAGFHAAYPHLHSTRYDLATLDLNQVLDGVDLVLVHEWNDHDLVRRIGEHRASNRSYTLLFHDTHHRAVTDAPSMAAYDLRHYDGVLAFGNIIRDIYLERGWTQRAWTWHEAADTRIFRSQPVGATASLARKQSDLYPLSFIPDPSGGDLVWIGNWGDEERTAELREFLIEPVRALGLRARVHGVRYSEATQQELAEAGIEYAGWLPNYAAPQVFARFKATVHVMRRPYVESLPGIPTIRVFEALACGIPLVCSPWDDAEHLFTPGADFLIARNGPEMQRHLHTIINDADAAATLAQHGLATIQARHTCAHRVDELLEIVPEARGDRR